MELGSQLASWWRWRHGSSISYQGWGWSGRQWFGCGFQDYPWSFGCRRLSLPSWRRPAGHWLWMTSSIYYGRLTMHKSKCRLIQVNHWSLEYLWLERKVLFGNPSSMWTIPPFATSLAAWVILMMVVVSPQLDLLLTPVIAHFNGELYYRWWYWPKSRVVDANGGERETWPSVGCCRWWPTEAWFVNCYFPDPATAGA